MAPPARPFVVAVLVSLLAGAIGCARCPARSSCEVAHAVPAEPVAAGAADDEAVKRYYGVPVRSDSVLYIVGDPPGKVLIWKRHGKILESIDGGKTWTQVVR